MNTVRIATGAARAIREQEVIRSIHKAAYALLMMAAGLAVAGSASAAVIKDFVGDSQEISRKGSHWFLHDLTNDDFGVGSEAVTWALLTIVLEDEDGKDGYKIAIGPASHVVKEDKHADGSVSFHLDEESLAVLSSTGKLGVTIWSKSCEGKKCGDGAIEFKSSTLEVKTALVAAVPQAAAVPEPGTLSLLGMGLAGVAALRFRRARNPVERRSQTAA